MTFVEVLSLLRTMGMELDITNDPYLNATKFELRYKCGPCRYSRNEEIRNDILTRPEAEAYVCQCIVNMIEQLDEYAGISKAQEIMNREGIAP